MQIQTLLLTLTLLFTPLVSAVGSAIVKNNCKHPIYLWSVGGSVGPKKTIQPGGTYSETFRRDPASGGVSLKITKVNDGIFNGSPQLNFAYTLDGNQLWYDLSDVFGDPFAGSALVVKPKDTGCSKICWPQGTPPGGSQVKICSADSDETLTVCAASC
ncbi:hypothetical protein P170DRAFT_444197 [Aspergillus steynii IBT 23096]|uniref:BYS1 domain protein n=1 Tax=Aspergillus steynii IBT 23096 TaxID=1392250 RepID=A0A2I2GGY9_9EURO|nr:uncharacterized protein P170DRAFT_444197 [Aspergillus steynii IBT 23096]PLB52148.1 hypothetical protein P170DRAFT_444197 [Aspergillus steynii IBT 23096]